MARAKVLIVDDHPLVRQGLAARIAGEPDLEVCGEASGVDEALALLDATEPALVIVDLMLKAGHGLTLVKKVAQRAPRTKILVLSAHEEALFGERSIRAGAHGYVNKQEAQEKIIAAMRAVLRGERFLSAETIQRLIGRAAGTRSKEKGIESLSDRELEVFELIGRGKSTRSIAQKLHLSVHTIESHRENIRAKLSLQNGAELVQRAVQWVLEPRAPDSRRVAAVVKTTT
jgi:DNA-binding NarL/FixJ family response regulator